MSGKLRQLGAYCNAVCSVDGGAHSRAQAALPELDAGFATLAMRRMPEWPGLELHIRAVSSDTSEGSIQRMLGFLDGILDSSRARRGFLVTYDLCTLCRPQVGLTPSIMCWGSDAGRQAKWLEFCVGWRVIVPREHFQAAMEQLATFFSMYPPMCRTWLLSTDDCVMIYEPEEPEATLRAREAAGDVAATVAAGPGLSARMRKVPPLPLLRCPDTLCRAAARGAGADGGRAPADGEPPGAQSLFADRVTCPPFLDLGFISMSRRGPNDDSEYGLIHAVANDVAGLTEDGQLVVMEYLDGFFFSDEALPGFVASFDLRNLNSMPMGIFRKFAEWGCEPRRKARMEDLAVEINLIVPEGMTYTVAKAAFTAFFTLFPPTPPVYLLTRPDEPKDQAVVFGGPPEGGPAAPRNAGA